MNRSRHEWVQGPLSKSSVSLESMTARNARLYCLVFAYGHTRESKEKDTILFPKEFYKETTSCDVSYGHKSTVHVAPSHDRDYNSTGLSQVEPGYAT